MYWNNRILGYYFLTKEQRATFADSEYWKIVFGSTASVFCPHQEDLELNGVFYTDGISLCLYFSSKDANDVGELGVFKGLQLDACLPPTLPSSAERNGSR